MLASYDTMAMNAIAAIGILLFMCERGVGGITAMSEVLCGQFNGAEDYRKVAIPAWQMLFFSLFSLVIFVPMGLFAGPYIIQPIFHETGMEFYRILMCATFLTPAFLALAGFFIGTKQVKIIAVTTTISNLVNIGLDYIFIFGIKGHIEPMGAKGAAIGTSIALVVQFLIILGAFLSKKQDQKYKTRSISFDFAMMMQALKIGVPNTFGWVASLSGLYAVVLIVSDVGVDFLTVHNICQNIFIFTYFMSEGIQRTVVGLGANILGARRYEEIWQLIRSALTLQFITLVILSGPMLIFPRAIVGLYITDPHLITLCSEVLFWVWVYYIIDGTAWIFGATLAAGGDTIFIAVAVFFSVWILRVAPLYFFEQAGIMSYDTSWFSGNLADLVLIGIFFARLKWANWRKVKVDIISHS